MSALILVVTPHTAFGELLRISLEDSAQYQVRLAQSAKEARAAAEKGVFQLAIVDTAINDEPFVPFCYELLELQPGIRLVVVPPENNPNHPGLGGLIPHGYLNRPFYLPDLIDVVSRLLLDREKQLRSRDGEPAPAAARPGTAAAAAPSNGSLPSWLQEPLTLQSYLEKELASTEALAGVIGINGPEPGAGTLRATAGKFDEAAAQELATVIFRYWNSMDRTDLMRFVRLSADKKDYLIYATQVAGELVLILVYDNTAPLSQIRPQTKALAQTLVSHPPENYLTGPRTVFAVGDEPEIPDEPGTAIIYDEPAAAQEPAVPTEADNWEPAQDEDSLPAAQETAPVAPESPPVERVSAANEPLTEPLDDDFLFNRLSSGISTGEETPSAVQPTGEPAADPPAPLDRFDMDESELEMDGEPLDANLFNLSALLGSVPPPDPEKPPRRELPFASDWILERSGSTPIPTLPGGYNGFDHSSDLNGDAKRESPEVEPQPEPPALEEVQSQASAAEETGPQSPSLPQTAPLDPNVVDAVMHRRFIDPDTYPIAPSGRPASLEVNTEPPVKPSILPPVENALTPVQPAALEPEDEDETTVTPQDYTHPSVVTTIASMAQFEPASPALSLLNYTCVLVPRLPQHYLTGDLADKMAVWVQQLCLAFGWRLEGISVRPEYLQWTVQVAPAVSPGNLVRVIRQRTSQHIFSTFPGLATHNPSGDFWAIGYLIVSGVQPPSAQLLRDYIAQTRKRQGINR